MKPFSLNSWIKPSPLRHLSGTFPPKHLNGTFPLICSDEGNIYHRVVIFECMTEVTNSAKHNYSSTVRFRIVYHSVMYSNTIIWHHPRKCFEDGNICHRVVIFWVYDRVTNSAEHDWSSTVKFQIIYCSAMLRLPLFIIHGIKRCMHSSWQLPVLKPRFG